MAESQRTLFRQALQKALAAQLLDENGDPLHFEAGVVEGPQADRELGCVWWEGKRPFARAGILEENYYRVRILKRFMQDQGGEEPRTHAAETLEQAAEELEAALAAVLTLPWLVTASGEAAAGDHDFFNVVEVTTNYQAFAVEAQLTAFATNRSSRGG